MKAGFLRLLFVSVLVALAYTGAWAQNKTQAYYNSHEREILPDAREAFKNGNYDRTVELCRWHYIIVGDRAADALRDQAERCGQLSQRMASLKSEGKTAEAKMTAQTLLSINPADAAAKKLVEEIEAVEKAAERERELARQRELEKERELERERERQRAAESKLVTVDTVAVEKPAEEPVKEVRDIDLDPYRPVTQTTTPVQKPKSAAPKTMFVIKAGATVVDLNQFAIAPGGSLGVYNMGGSPVGLEAGFYVCPGLMEHTVSMVGVDAAMVLRLGNCVYPKVGVGYFSCSSSVRPRTRSASAYSPSTGRNITAKSVV